MRTCGARDAEALGSFSGARTDAREFCPAADATPYLVAMGIFTVDEHRDGRAAIRDTWLRGARAAGFAARFVLHGLGARVESVKEAEQHGDILFLRAPAKMDCRAGPLHKLLLWLSCALLSFPAATLVGKCDDDIWAHLPGVGAHARASLAQLTAISPAALMVWGFIENYHWHLVRHRPTGFGGLRYFFREERGKRIGGKRRRPSRVYMDCTRRIGGYLHGAPTRNYSDTWRPHPDGPVSGPFAFPKGPMYMISADLARTIVDSSWVKDEAEAALQQVRDQAASKNDRAVLTAAEPTWPWEDVFIGAALAHAVPRGPNLLAYVHAGYERYVEEWGTTVAPSTLVWHQKSKVPARIRMIDTWQMSHHCELPSRYVVYNKNYTSCTGATWICGETALDRSRRTNCSSRYENLLGHAKRAEGAFHHGKVSRRGAAAGSQDGNRPTAAARRRVAAAGRGAGPGPHYPGASLSVA